MESIMKDVILLLGAGCLFGCTGSGWSPPEGLMLEGFQVHEGYHCESSAMLNLLQYQGYAVTEDRIIGAGALRMIKRR